MATGMTTLADPASTSPDLNQVGQEVTRKTIQHLYQRERDLPGIVHPVVVYFRQDLRPDTLEFMRSATRNQGNRETRYAIAWKQAERMQQSVRDFLWSDRAAAECFAACPHFCYEPNRLVRPLPVTNTLLTPATSRLVEKLSQHRTVLAVQSCFPVFTAPGDTLEKLDQVVPLARAGTPFAHRDGYTWGWHRLGIPYVHQVERLSGKGVPVGIINTGVCEEHADLKFKVHDFAKVEPSGRLVPAHSFDLHGHGTHCAGIMVGANNSGAGIGGAPASDLKGVSIMDDGHTWSSALMVALEWLADPYRTVYVINLSLGIEQPSAESKLLLEETVQRIANQGIILVAAIGNDAGRSMYPAKLDNVIGCGALMPGDRLWTSSGSNPDFVLPGVSVYSCLPPGNPDLGGQSYGWRTGTSCAAAHMTALVALLMERKPHLGRERILQVLRETADHRGPADKFGWGVPNLRKALQY